MIRPQIQPAISDAKTLMQHPKMSFVWRSAQGLFHTPRLAVIVKKQDVFPALISLFLQFLTQQVQIGIKNRLGFKGSANIHGGEG